MNLLKIKIIRRGFNMKINNKIESDIQIKKLGLNRMLEGLFTKIITL